MNTQISLITLGRIKKSVMKQFAIYLVLFFVLLLLIILFEWLYRVLCKIELFWCFFSFWFDEFSFLNWLTYLMLLKVNLLLLFFVLFCRCYCLNLVQLFLSSLRFSRSLSFSVFLTLDKRTMCTNQSTIKTNKQKKLSKR